MPPPPAPLTLAEPEQPASAPAPRPGLDRDTVREMLAVLLLLAGSGCVGVAGFMLGPVVGLFALGAMLLGLGVLLGTA